MAVESAILTLTDVVDFLHPLPGPLYARLAVPGAGVAREDFFRLRNDKWESPEFPPGRSPSMEDLIKTNSWSRVEFSPWLNLTSVASACAPYDVVVALFPLPSVDPARLVPLKPIEGETDHLVLQARQLETILRQQRIEGKVIDPDAADLIFARLRDLGEMRPSLVVNEIDRIAALWRLSDRYNESTLGHGWSSGQPVLGGTGVFANILHRLASRLDGDRTAVARPSHLMINAPGSRRQELRLGRTPSPMVTAEIWNEDLFTLDSILKFAAGQ